MPDPRSSSGSSSGSSPCPAPRVPPPLPESTDEGHHPDPFADPEDAPPEPTASDSDSDTFVVERIVNDVTDEAGQIWYEVKWAGYDDPRENSWFTQAVSSHLCLIRQASTRADPG